MSAMSKQIEGEPGELEALLPWYANGTLDARDARRVEDALASDQALAAQYAAIQDEYAETIVLIENLGAPSSHAMQRLFAAIDAEPERKPSRSMKMPVRIAGFFARLSPRTLAYSAAVGAIALVLQAGIIGAVLVKGATGYQTASYQDAQKSSGTLALIRFVPDARMSDISAFLDNYKASIVDGPKAGTFRVRIGDTSLSKDETARLVNKIQSEKIIGFVAAAD